MAVVLSFGASISKSGSVLQLAIVSHAVLGVALAALNAVGWLGARLCARQATLASFVSLGSAQLGATILDGSRPSRHAAAENRFGGFEPGVRYPARGDHALNHPLLFVGLVAELAGVRILAERPL